MSLPALRCEENTTTASATSSPKRKRTDSIDPATAAAFVKFAPRLSTLNTNSNFTNGGFLLEQPELETPDSPRTSVADKFSTLDLQELNAGMPVLEFGATEKASAGTPKRAKKDENPTKTMNTTTKPTTSAASKEKSSPAAEIPNPSTDVSSAGPRGKSDSIMDKTDILAMIEDGPSSSTQNPVDGTPVSIAAEKNNHARRVNSRLPKINDLFWHESEITGYSMSDPDDDGTGLNGIGFRPTPTVAYLRESQRRDRIKEWKALEARKEREKRTLRRRGLLAQEEAKKKSAAKRSVHFADAVQTLG